MVFYIFSAYKNKICLFSHTSLIFIASTSVPTHLQTDLTFIFPALFKDVAVIVYFTFIILGHCGFFIIRWIIVLFNASNFIQRSTTAFSLSLSFVIEIYIYGSINIMIFGYNLHFQHGSVYAVHTSLTILAVHINRNVDIIKTIDYFVFGHRYIIP